MDAAIVGLVGLGGLYAIANQKDNKEGFESNSLPNQKLPPKNYPIQSNNLKNYMGCKHVIPCANGTDALQIALMACDLKPGDEVEILSRGTETVITTSSPTYIESVDTAQNTLSLQNLPTGFTTSTQLYDVRRKLNKTQSSGSGFESDTLLSDVLNLYVDKDEYAYIASNSLPSRVRNFTVNDYRFDVQENVKSVEINSIAGLDDLIDDVYNSFVSTNVPFITGDVVYYSSQEEPLAGLTTGTYFVQKVTNNKFKL